MITRREALVRMGSFLGAGAVGLSPVRAEVSTGTQTSISAAASRGPLVIAHITDTHITDEYESDKWVSKCFQQIQSHPSKPTMILHTGDIIMDSVHTERKRVEDYWKTWNSTVLQECSLPIHYAIGNHDVWGARYPENDPAKSDPMFGKKLAQERLSLPRLYSSIDAGSWQIIMLDSITPFATVQDGVYDWIAKLDEEQFSWLEKELGGLPADKPVLVGLHIPILQMTSMASLQPDENGSYTLGPKNMMVDARKLVDLFHKHKNVKFSLSGHMHYKSLVELNGVSYFNAGSVCGVQWKHMDQSPDRPGFTIAKLYPDGKFEYEYIPYGWQPGGKVAEAA